VSLDGARRGVRDQGLDRSQRLHRTGEFQRVYREGVSFPGRFQVLFVLREAGPALRTLKKLKRYDLLLVDGHGRLHPRRCGLACYLGVALNKPAIGVAKSILCGTAKDGKVEYEGEVLGAVIEGRKKLYVSVGHRMSLESAVSTVKSWTKRGEWLPEPLRLADAYSRL